MTIGEIGHLADFRRFLVDQQASQETQHFAVALAFVRPRRDAMFSVVDEDVVDAFQTRLAALEQDAKVYRVAWADFAIVPGRDADPRRMLNDAAAAFTERKVEAKLFTGQFTAGSAFLDEWTRFEVQSRKALAERKT